MQCTGAVLWQCFTGQSDSIPGLTVIGGMDVKIMMMHERNLMCHVIALKRNPQGGIRIETVHRTGQAQQAGGSE